MPAQTHAHPAIAAGLAGGIGLIIPAAAYFATASIPEMHDAVAGAGMPFAVGAVAGAGMCSLAAWLMERDAIREEEAYRTASARRVAQAAARAVPAGAEERFVPFPEEREEREGGLAGITSALFSSRRELSDVPVIARAADALSEADAWAEIDALLTEDSPVSCDAARSKDIYQIAFDELSGSRRGNVDVAAGAGAVATAAPVAAPAPGAGSVAAERPAPAISVPEMPVATAPGFASASWQPTSSTAQVPSASVQAASPADGGSQPVAAAPVSEVASSRVAVPVAVPASAMPVAPAPGSASAFPVAFEELPDPSEVEVPMADYSGHEGMWAAALAILDEAPAASVTSVIPAMGEGVVTSALASEASGDAAVTASIEFEAEVPSAPAPVPPAPRVRAASAPVSAERAEAMAEGARETAMHGRVNEILSEELANIRSKSMRRATHEYLRVIQGGTMSMPRLRAEA